MAQVISGMRFARSYLTPSNAQLTGELDFNLAVRGGVQVHAVAGHMAPLALVAQSDLTPTNGHQTLHLETDALETIPNADAEDELSIDSEVFYRQDAAFVSFNGTTEAAAAIHLSPNGLVVFPEPILSARNITHAALSNGAFAIGWGVIVYFKYVIFSNAELGILLSRR